MAESGIKGGGKAPGVDHRAWGSNTSRRQSPVAATRPRACGTGASHVISLPAALVPPTVAGCSYTQRCVSDLQQMQDQGCGMMQLGHEVLTDGKQHSKFLLPCASDRNLPRMGHAHRHMRSVPRSPAVTKKTGRFPALPLALLAAFMPGKSEAAGSATTPAYTGSLGV